MGEEETSTPNSAPNSDPEFARGFNCIAYYELIHMSPRGLYHLHRSTFSGLLAHNDVLNFHLLRSLQRYTRETLLSKSLYPAICKCK